MRAVPGARGEVAAALQPVQTPAGQGLWQDTNGLVDVTQKIPKGYLPFA